MLARRSVRQLRVRAADEALARHGRVLVEDALRTASLPGDDARLLLIRHLRLPAFHAGSSAQSVALGLEGRCREAPVLAVPDGVPVDDALLAAAPAVSFGDRLSAHLGLTRLLLAGHRPLAWCWRLVVTGYTPELDRPAALACIARSVAALEERAVALPLWLDEVVCGGGGDDLCIGLERAPLPDLAASSAASPAGRSRSGAEPAWRQLLQWLAQRSPDSPARAWLEALAPAASRVATGQAVAGAPAPGAVPAVSNADVAAEGDGRRHRPHRRVAEAGVGSSPSPPALAPAVPASPADLRPRQAPPPRPFSTRPVAEPIDVRPPVSLYTAAGAADERRADGLSEAACRPSPVALPTGVRGLLFLLPVLRRCGFDDWLLDNPGWLAGSLPALILARLMDRLRVPADDALRALAGDLEATGAGPQQVCLPLAWREQLARGRPRRFHDGRRRALFDADGRLPLAFWQGRAPAGWVRTRARAEARCLPDAEVLLPEAWLRACRRLLRRRLGLGIATLVRGPALASVTPLSVDLWLPADSVSLPVRRHGLDLDPGWVPWLGRIVRFHYTEPPR